jgi:hypothetical protein
MKSREFTEMVFCTLGLVAVLSAQTPGATPPVPPSGPLMAKAAPDFAQWTATTKFEVSSEAVGATAPAAAGDPSAKKSVVQVVKTGNIRHVTLVRENGTKSENWCEGDMQVITCPEWPLPVLSSGKRKEDAARVDFSHGDFTGLDWISAKNFVGIRKFGGGDCLMFKDSVPRDAAFSLGRSVEVNDDNGHEVSTAKPPLAPAVAYIDLKTRLPVSLQWGNELTTYTFDNPPTAKLSLPPPLQAVIDDWLAQKKRNMHVAVHP